MTRRRLLALIEAVVSCPSTSYHEHLLRDLLAQHAAHLGLPVAQDRWGNLHVRYSRGRRKIRWTVLAHMDHPGFVVTAARGNTATCRWFGRVEPRFFRRTPVAMHTPNGPARGQVTRVRLSSTPRRVRWIRVRTETPWRPGQIGTWALPAFAQRGHRLHLRAADDLVGCALLAALLEMLASAKTRAHVQVVYTRAEEAGLVGAAALARDGALSSNDPILALETSRELPGALLGRGPVVRVGDRLGVYDPGLSALLMKRAGELAGRRKRFRFQRCLMDGGLCEASAFAAHGYRAAGLAVSLGNYHNMGRLSIRPEIVDLADLEGALALLEAVVAGPWPRDGWPAAVEPSTFRPSLREGEPLLRRSIARPIGRWPQTMSDNRGR